MTEAVRVPLPPVQHRFGARLALCAAALTLALAGCVAPEGAGGNTPEPGVASATRNGPEGAAPGTCWGRTISPAVVVTVTEQVQEAPARINPDGSIGKPPVYRTETRQEIATPRRDNWFQTPCPEVTTPEFIASLQRALAARGIYSGPVTGTMDPETRAAVRSYQRGNGPDSGVISLEAARALGLVAVPRPDAEAD